MKMVRSTRERGGDFSASEENDNFHTKESCYLQEMFMQNCDTNHESVIDGGEAMISI